MRNNLSKVAAVVALGLVVGCGSASEVVTRPAAGEVAISTLIGREGNTLNVTGRATAHSVADPTARVA